MHERVTLESHLAHPPSAAQPATHAWSLSGSVGRVGTSGGSAPGDRCAGTAAGTVNRLREELVVGARAPRQMRSPSPPAHTVLSPRSEAAPPERDHPVVLPPRSVPVVVAPSGTPQVPGMAGSASPFVARASSPVRLAASPAVPAISAGAVSPRATGVMLSGTRHSCNTRVAVQPTRAASPSAPPAGAVPAGVLSGGLVATPRHALRVYPGADVEGAAAPPVRAPPLAVDTAAPCSAAGPSRATVLAHGARSPQPPIRRTVSNPGSCRLPLGGARSLPGGRLR